MRRSGFLYIFYIFRLHMFKNQLSAKSLFLQEIHARSATLTNRSMKIYRIENVGSCCWEVYSKPHFSGEKEKIRKNHDDTPKIKDLRTARVIDC